ncbi:MULTISPECIES: hypothetical protein [Bradyrhizobium]|jgi:hypothetical protein|uniref:hypothetical protein n=1 Tax=Bradyrhizobium TaxID=374 RepID=UPI0011A740EE|nr:hypothetical protein [Bradyrhizobium huanghuaihaiense]
MTLVPGGGPAAFRALQDGATIGRADLPPKSPAAFSQANFKKGKLIRHCYRLSLLRGAGSTVTEKRF